MLRWIFLFMAGAATSMMVAPSFAEPVELLISNNLTARAEFRKGDSDKPAVLLLHGFLQTHEFPTIHRLTDGLAGAGYSVLAPTLTLGVTHRKQSLACEAIHTHTMDDAIKEIAAWANWLHARKAPAIVLIGHSFGSVETLAYLSRHSNAPISKLIGVSVVEGRLKIDEKALDKLIRSTRAQVKSGKKSLITEQFSFCQKFLATPGSMLSYIEWSPARILAETGRLALPTTFIMGSRDDRLGSSWIERLNKTRAKVHVIEGANHFMDGDFEFDLLDRILLEVKAF